MVLVACLLGHATDLADGTVVGAVEALDVRGQIHRLPIVAGGNVAEWSGVAHPRHAVPEANRVILEPTTYEGRSIPRSLWLLRLPIPGGVPLQGVRVRNDCPSPPSGHGVVVEVHSIHVLRRGQRGLRGRALSPEGIRRLPSWRDGTRPSPRFAGVGARPRSDDSVGSPELGEIVAAPSSATASSSVAGLGRYPRPRGDTGRGVHWIPTTGQDASVVDRFADDCARMHVKWVVFLNDRDAIGANDHLVDALVARGIMPIMRIYQSPIDPAPADRIGKMVAHYTARGCFYYEIFNEPNLYAVEWQGRAPNDMTEAARITAEGWVRLAEAVKAAGGLPAIPNSSPGAPDGIRWLYTDWQEAFLRQVMGLRPDGAIFEGCWISVHNYSSDWQGDPETDSHFLLRPVTEAQNAYLRVTGRGTPLPVIATEGGFQANSDDRDSWQERVSQAYLGLFRYVESRKTPYLLASCPWLLANKVAGGHDADWERATWFWDGGHWAFCDVLAERERLVDSGTESTSSSFSSLPSESLSDESPGIGGGSFRYSGDERVALQGGIRWRDDGAFHLTLHIENHASERLVHAIAETYVDGAKLEIDGRSGAFGGYVNIMEGQGQDWSMGGAESPMWARLPSGRHTLEILAWGELHGSDERPEARLTMEIDVP